MITIIANNIASFESTFAFTELSHFIVFEAHYLFTFATEEVVELVWTFRTLSVCVGSCRDLVAEGEETSSAAVAFDERGAWVDESGSAGRVDTVYCFFTHGQVL